MSGVKGQIIVPRFFFPHHDGRLNQYSSSCSSNHLETCAALMALCKLITLEMVPAVIDQVLKALSHDQVAVRKKAVMVLHRLYQINPELIQLHQVACRKCLFDKDPSVMVRSSVNIYDGTIRSYFILNSFL